MDLYCVIITPKLSRVKAHPLSWVAIVELCDVHQDVVVPFSHGHFDGRVDWTFKVFRCSVVVAHHTGVHVGG